jgi:SAM-dependent methyltransferase
MVQIDSHKPWFRTWFDTPYYHVLYANRDHKEAAAFIDRLVTALGLKEGDKVMDLACGKGRHALHLASKGFHVTGLDLSQNSIDSLVHHNSESLHFEQWDMRIPYKEGGYDAVFNLFTSFGYFESSSENLKVLEAMKQVIKADRHILIDYLNVKKALTVIDKKEHIKRQGLEFFTAKSLQKGCIIKEIKIKDGQEEFKFSESVQALTLLDFKELIEKAGLQLVQTYGDYHLSPFDELRSPRLILQLRK